MEENVMQIVSMKSDILLLLDKAKTIRRKLKKFCLESEFYGDCKSAKQDCNEAIEAGQEIMDKLNRLSGAVEAVKIIASVKD